MINTSIFGPLRGRIGNLTAYTRMGKQVFRAINDSPHNPQTPAQMARRTLMAGVVGAYKVLAPFVADSYETKLPTQTAYNRFTSNNLKQVTVYLDKSEAVGKICVVAGYNVSEGTLPPIELEARGNRLVSSIVLSGGFVLDENTTLGHVSAELVKNNVSMKYGDKITILHLVQTGAYLTENEAPPRAELELYEFTLDKQARAPFYTLVPKELFGVEEGRVATDPTLRMGAVGYVHSRKSGRVTRYSTQSLVITPDNTLKSTYESPQKCQQAGESYRKRRGSKTEAPQSKIAIKKAEKVVDSDNYTFFANGMPKRIGVT